MDVDCVLASVILRFTRRHLLFMAPRERVDAVRLQRARERHLRRRVVGRAHHQRRHRAIRGVVENVQVTARDE